MRRPVVSKPSAQAASIVAGCASTTRPSAGDTTGLGRAMRRPVVSGLSPRACSIVAGCASTTLSSVGETTGPGRPNAPTGSFKSVSAGGVHSCGIRSDNTVLCWGAMDVILGNPDAWLIFGSTYEPGLVVCRVGFFVDGCVVGWDRRHLLGLSRATETWLRALGTPTQAGLMVAPYAATTLSPAGEATMLGRPPRRRVVSKTVSAGGRR